MLVLLIRKLRRSEHRVRNEATYVLRGVGAGATIRLIPTFLKFACNGGLRNKLSLSDLAWFKER